MKKNFLHSEFDAGPNHIVLVTLDSQANVMLLDQMNFDHYRKGESFRYYGGLAKVSPIRLVPPHNGRWHVVVDLGGYSGTVKAAVQLLDAAKAVN